MVGVYDVATLICSMSRAGDVFKVALEFVCILVQNFCEFFLFMKTWIFIMNEYLFKQPVANYVMLLMQ